MSLIDNTIRNAKLQQKPVRLYDGGGLYLEVAPQVVMFKVQLRGKGEIAVSRNSSPRDHEAGPRAPRRSQKGYSPKASSTRAQQGKPPADLRGALPPSTKKSFAAITDPKDVGALLRAIEGYRGRSSSVAPCALGVRPPRRTPAGRVVRVRLGTGEWRIPGSKMKMKEPHIVPLSRQAISILEELRLFTGSGRYLFPGERSKDWTMGDGTVNAAHGLRF